MAQRLRCYLDVNGSIPAANMIIFVAWASLLQLHILWADYLVRTALPLILFSVFCMCNTLICLVQSRCILQHVNSTTLCVFRIISHTQASVSHVTLLSIMQQCCCWCDSTVNVMRQHCWSCDSDRQCCRSCDSAIIDVTALSTWCDWAVDLVTALSTWCDSAVDHVTALSIMWQHCPSRDSAIVDVMALSTWCNIAVNHATVLSYDWQCCHITSTVPSHQQRHCCMINSAVTWLSALWHHATVLLLMCRCCPRDATALSIMQQCRRWCETLSMSHNSTVNHAVRWSTALSCDCQHSHMHNSYVVQWTTKLFKGQCCHLIDSDCVTIVFPDFPLYLRIKQLCLCTQKGIWATRFSSFKEQIFLKLLV